MKDGRLVFDYNEFHHHARLEASAPLAPGAREIVLEVVRRPDGGGDVRLSVDGETAATGALPRLLFMISSTGMDIGRSLSPVTADYAAPFTYPGRIRQVVFEIPDLAAMGEVKAFVRAEMTRQ